MATQPTIVPLSLHPVKVWFRNAAGKWYPETYLGEEVTSPADKRQTIADYVYAHPEQTYASIAARLGCHPSTVSVIAREFGIVRGRRLNGADLERLD